MRKIFFAAIVSLGAIAAASPALAQDEAPAPSTSSTSSRSIEPYVGVNGVWESFDSSTNSAHIPPVGLEGWAVEGVAGVNVPLGDTFFAGVEGNVTKGVDGDIDWEYGAAGRAGLNLDGSLLYAKAGYQWVEFDNKPVAGNKTYDGVVWGGGFELAPMANKNLRVRGEFTTMNSIDSIRPTLGVVMGF